MNLRYIMMQPENTLANVIGEVYRWRINANTGFIRNYLSKEVRKLKLDCDSFNTIAVILDPVLDTCYKWDEKTLLIHMKYTTNDVEELSRISNLELRYEYFLNLLVRGYKLAMASGFNLPLAELLQLHEQFRRNHYKNSWIWKKKTLRDIGKKIIFSCDFTSVDFTFNLELFDMKGNFITKSTIMRTPPFEVCYEKDFRKLVVTENKIVILDFLDHPSFEIDLASMQNNIIVSKQLNVNDEIEKSYEEEYKIIDW